MSHRAMGPAPPRVQIADMMEFMDWWQVEPADFEGSRCLGDASFRSSRLSGQAVARLFVISAISCVLGDKRKPVVDGLAAASYVAALFAADDAEGGALNACLSAVQQQDVSALATSLHEAARVCAAHCAPYAARSLAELGYEAALEVGAWQDAYFAARTLERLAVLDECPPAADRWGRRAELQLRRVQRGTRTV